ncbi:MAG: hypothetical protein ACE5EY_13125, partial [Anaerolineae bacterium]
GISLLTDRVVSAKTPQVVLAAGAAAWTNTGVYTISWQGSDGDWDALAYDVAFSRDGGQTWQMIATQLITTSLTVNSADFPGTDTAVLRVYATDGILTAEDTGTPFTIADKAPTAVITLPQDNAVFPLNQPVLLKGMAYDWEDGFLDASAFQWQSSLDGDLGAGVEKILTSLSAGSHLITLTVTDSDNRQTTAQIKIYVGSAGTAVFLPVILSP